MGQWLYFPDATPPAWSWVDNYALEILSTEVVGLEIDSPGVAAHTAGTVFFTVKLGAPSATNYLFSMSSNDNGGSNAYILLRVVASGATWKFQLLRRNATTGANDVAISSPSNTAVAGAVTRIAITSEMKLYINGSLAASTANPGWFAGLGGATPQLMELGASRAKTGGAVNSIEGYLNNAWFMNRVATSTEVSDDYTDNDWLSASYVADITNAYPLEQDLNDYVGSDDLTASGTIVIGDYITP